VKLRLAKSGIRRRVDRAHHARAAGRIFVERKSGVADVGAVGFVVLREVGFFLVRLALEVGPGLELHGRKDRVEAGGAAAVELGLAESGIPVSRRCAHETGARGVHVEADLGRLHGRTVGLVSLNEIALLFGGVSLEVRPRLELHRRRDRVHPGRAAAVLLGLAESGVGVRRDGADERRGRKRRIFLVIGDRRVADGGAVCLVVLSEVGFFLIRLAFEVGPGLELHRHGDDGRTGRAAAPELRLAKRGVRRRLRGADDRCGVVWILVIGYLRAADGRTVRAIVLKIVCLFLAGFTLEVGPRLELHRSGGRGGAGHAATPELSLALGGIAVGVERAYESGGVRGVLVVGDLRAANRDAVALVVLEVICLLFRGIAFEVGPGLERHSRADDVRTCRAIAELFGLAERGVPVGVRRAHERGAAVRILVIRDRGVLNRRAVRFVALDEVGLFFAGKTAEVGPRLEAHRPGNRVHSGGAVLVHLRLTERGIRVGLCRAYESRRGIVGILLVIGNRGVLDRGAVSLVALREVGLLLVRLALHVGPSLKFHGRREGILAGHAAAEELGLA